MIISCIKCSKKFETDDKLIPDEGRFLQCGSCDHKWFFIKDNKVDINNNIPSEEISSEELFENEKKANEETNNNTIDKKDIKNVKNSNKNINFIEQLILILFVYIIVGFLIALPIYMSNLETTFLGAFFESVSGLTGTGFSVFNNIKYLDPTLILWRSSSQWIGGLYFLIFLIIIFSNKSFNYKMTNLTYSGENNFNTK